MLVLPLLDSQTILRKPFALGAGGPCGDGRAMRLAKGEAFGWSAPIPCPAMCNVWSNQSIKKYIRHHQINEFLPVNHYESWAVPHLFNDENHKTQQNHLSDLCEFNVLQDPAASWDRHSLLEVHGLTTALVIQITVAAVSKACELVKWEKWRAFAHPNHFSYTIIITPYWNGRNSSLENSKNHGDFGTLLFLKVSRRKESNSKSFLLPSDPPIGFPSNPGRP